MATLVLYPCWRERQSSLEDLKPYTISNSIKNAPTVLLTEEGKNYTLWSPITEDLKIIHYLREYCFAHFKMRSFETAKFSYKGQSFLCIEEEEATIEFDEWQVYLWESKRKFNQFLQPNALFVSFLFDTFFPLFGGRNTVLIVPGKKNSFRIHPVPANNYASFKFSPLNFSQSGLNIPSIKQFFSYQKAELDVVLEEFLALNDEKFQVNLKHQLSLFPSKRNAYWDELRKCFEPEFMNYTTALFKDFILHL